MNRPLAIGQIATAAPMLLRTTQSKVSEKSAWNYESYVRGVGRAVELETMCVVKSGKACHVHVAKTIRIGPSFRAAAGKAHRSTAALCGPARAGTLEASAPASFPLRRACVAQLDRGGSVSCVAAQEW